MEFKDRLKYCRKERKVTQEKLAEKLGIKRPTYAKYETGENQPDIAMLNKLADFFDVSTDYLLGRTDIRDTSNISYAAKDGASSRSRTKEQDEEMTEKFRQFLEWQREVKGKEEE
ncbi:helix-turn-helix transcriptional regulator [Alkalihalophilus marmarensis]|uniref:helix-turn-helix domain-containing protein n=1 Tax=Alkalihalophilus marmarensis TaxID=521377 RepID=UPI002E217C2C|nr:helix-turn-helix transcriptional regulator [Alkalihalophilus marmarensis]